MSDQLGQFIQDGRRKFDAEKCVPQQLLKFLLEDILVRNTDLSAQCGHAAELVERLTAAAAAEALGRRAEVLWSTSAANVFAEGNGGGRICFPFPPNVQGTRTCTFGGAFGSPPRPTRANPPSVRMPSSPYPGGQGNQMPTASTCHRIEYRTSVPIILTCALSALDTHCFLTSLTHLMGVPLALMTAAIASACSTRPPAPT